MNNLEEMCRKYLGLPPFKDFCNIVMGDAFYLQSIYTRYGIKETDKMIDKLNRR